MINENGNGDFGIVSEIASLKKLNSLTLLRTNREETRERTIFFHIFALQ